MADTICLEAGCERPARTKGRCKYHYERDRLLRVRMANDATATGDLPAPPAGGVGDGEADPRGPVVADDQSDPVSDSPYLSSAEVRPGAGVGTPSSSAPGAPGRTETPPGAPVKPSLRERLLGPRKEKPAVTGPAPTTKERRPGRPAGGRRVSAAETLSDVWSGIGGLAIQTGTHAPVGRCLQWQAPVAGEMLDEALAGSTLDKVAVQRIVKGRQRFDLIGAVIGPPMLVLAIERNPGAQATLVPMLRSSIRRSLPLMVPAIKKVQERERKVAEATELLFADMDGFEPGTDPVDVILSMMFEGWVPPEPPTPDTSAGPSDDDSSTTAAPTPQSVPDIFDPGAVA